MTDNRNRRSRWVIMAGLLFLLPGCDILAPPSAEEQFDQALTADPNYTELYTVMREEFPREFARFRAEMISTVEASSDQRVVYEAGQAFMIEFVIANAADLAAAPEAVLLEARDANVALIEQLSRDDERLCGNFVMRGLQFGDTPSAASEELIGRVGVLQLRTIAAGRREPTPRGEPTEDDVNTYIDAMRARGMQDPEIDAFLAGTLATQSLTPADECRLGLAIYRALADIPPEASARISAVLLVPTE